MKIKEQKGAALVEFALLLPILLMILLGIIEFGIILYDKAIITNASREAARERVVFNAPGESVIRDKIVSSYGSLPITFGSDTLTTADISFTPTTEITGSYSATYWRASVNFRYDFLYLPFSQLNLTSSTTMREEQ